MRYIKHIILFLFGFMVINSFGAKPGFRHCGFYLHEGWFFNYPFAVRTWAREDFSKMFQLLRNMGYDQVAIWPMLEAIPMPLSVVDSVALSMFKPTIDDAHFASLECWLVQCANLTPDPSISAKPWNQRNPYHIWKHVRLDDPKEAMPYLAHRSKMISILNNADAYVTIDGDPGGYEGARPEEWLKVFLSDRSVLERDGLNPSQQRLIPWVWSGWGTKLTWGGDPTNPPERIIPYTNATMKLFKTSMPGPWEMLPGRSHRDGWANGRVNIILADSLGLMNCSTIFCYEAIEFEPTPPAAILQFDHIRRILREESKYTSSALGVFGNAQQPVMVLPNLYFFARGSNDLTYLDKSDEEILTDFAHFLGGPSDLLVPAWDCFQRDLESLPADLPKRLRACSLTGEPAAFIPGGPKRYLEILAQQTESRIRLLQATAEPTNSDETAAINIAKGVAALVSWWNVHHYVNDGNSEEPFRLSFVHNSQVKVLHEWCRKNVKDPNVVSGLVVEILSDNQTLTESQAIEIIRELLSK